MSQRSIPACAGKTRAGERIGLVCRVDPRVCGEDVPYRYADHLMCGRSPRVRGRLANSKRKVMADGSIPACAGKTAR